MRNHDPNPYDLLEQELYDESMLEMDLWFLADDDHIWEYWSNCPAHIRQEYIEDYESRHNLWEYEDDSYNDEETVYTEEQECDCQWSDPANEQVWEDPPR